MHIDRQGGLLHRRPVVLGTMADVDQDDVAGRRTSSADDPAVDQDDVDTAESTTVDTPADRQGQQLAGLLTVLWRCHDEGALLAELDSLLLGEFHHLRPAPVDMPGDVRCPPNRRPVTGQRPDTVTASTGQSCLAVTTPSSQTCLQALAAGEVGLLDLCPRCTRLAIEVLVWRQGQHGVDVHSGSADPSPAACRACGAPVTASRRDAVFCSARCRKHAHRNGRKGRPHARPTR